MIIFDIVCKEEMMATIGEDLPDLMTIEEVANFLRVSKITLKRWGKRGKLPAIRINQRGDRRYKKEAVLWLVGEMYKKTESPRPSTAIDPISIDAVSSTD